MDTRKYLVVACGRNSLSCKNHPSERWVSIDPSEKLNPDIVKSIEEVKPQDFQNKFEIAYLEGITSGVNLTRLTILNLLLEPDGALLAYPTNLRCLEQAEQIENFNLTYFILCNNFLILVKNNGNLEKICQVFKDDLSDHFAKEIKIKCFNQIDLLLQETKEIKNKYKDLHPNLISFLAHINVYIIERKNRKFYNLFKNKSYANFQVDIKDKLIQFNNREISKDTLISAMQEWQLQLTSTQTAAYKLPCDYIKLEDLLTQLITLIHFHDHVRLKEPRPAPYLLHWVPHSYTAS